MHHDENLRKRARFFCGREPSFELRNAQIVRVRIDVDKIDIRAAVERAVSRRNKTIRRSPYPIARPDAERLTSRVQSRSCAGNRDGEARSAMRGNGILKLRDRRAACEPVRAKGSLDSRNVAVIDLLPGVRH